MARVVQRLPHEAFNRDRAARFRDHPAQEIVRRERAASGDSGSTCRTCRDLREAGILRQQTGQIRIDRRRQAWRRGRGFAGAVSRENIAALILVRGTVFSL